MPNIFVVKKYVEDKDHKPEEFAKAQDAVMAERGHLDDYPDALFVVHEVDGGGNIVPNRDVDPRRTLKALEMEVRPKLADIIGSTKAIAGELQKEEEKDLGKIAEITNTIQEMANRLNDLFK